ncbi:hypothetical protein D5S18_05795 [Nocardia panacis]|uniref:DUF6879 domain-containing protein n=1 Tax=Nocardia panacis TaxID=2340916 RepID=A0A3A4L6K4_9NOCA|nr:DUF6879 family protein [Nocardia panacis]RJO78406.1 hypothetical protein D5S18_05795 [Nocardia panacis]
MRLILAGESFDQMIDQAQHRAFHLETEDQYLAAAEADSLRAWLADPRTDPGGDWFAPWAAQVRATVARRVAVQRVRIVSEPHTDYTRYLLALAEHNRAAGEQIRYLPRARADPRDAVAEDFWMLDDATVAYSVFDGAGYWIGAAVTEDPVLVGTAADIRDRVWSKSIPYGDYVIRWQE